ncbi:MAG: hypothetical protein RL204_660 [Bacteroidota bacterium]|jgi:hypothetical protein
MILGLGDMTRPEILLQLRELVNSSVRNSVEFGFRSKLTI